jgi:hypothetical protein
MALMNFKNVRPERLLVAIGLVGALLGCERIFNTVVAEPAQSIAGKTNLGPEWSTIQAPRALESKRDKQQVSIHLASELNGGVAFDPDDKTNTSLKLKDGRVIKLEAELIDNKGIAYLMRVGGVGTAIFLVRATPPRDVSKPPDAGPDFPKDREYTTLKIKSSSPISVEKIEWLCFNLM